MRWVWRLLRISLGEVFWEKSKLRWEAGGVDKIMDGLAWDEFGHLALGWALRGDAEDNSGSKDGPLGPWYVFRPYR